MSVIVIYFESPSRIAMKEEVVAATGYTANQLVHGELRRFV